MLQNKLWSEKALSEVPSPSSMPKNCSREDRLSKFTCTVICALARNRMES
jgi:hypothetical protein